MRSAVKGRFAPSPTGRMHAGNIFSALVAWLVAKSQGGRILLRIEDLDRERSKPAYADQVMRDFERLGLTWDEGPLYQHDRDEAYRAAFDRLDKQGLLYPCYCTRADLKAASAPHFGEKAVYPGTCRFLTPAQRADREAQGRRPAWRLHMPDETVNVEDIFQGAYAQNLASECGDYIVRRSDDLFAYQLAVTVDDAEQGVTSVVRGIDLLCSTPQQVHLRRLLGDTTDISYGHVPLLVGTDGRRLSKRHHDASLEALLARHKTPEAVIGHIAGVTGLTQTTHPVTPEALLPLFSIEDAKRSFVNRISISWPA